MKKSIPIKAAMAAAMAIGVSAATYADGASVDDLMKAMEAEIAQVREATKGEVVKETAASVVSTIKEANAAADAGTEAVVAVQDQKQVAGADPNVPSSFNVSDKVKERTAAALKVDKNEIGNFNHKTGRIVVIGEAAMTMDVKDDKIGAWAIKRTMLAKSALLNAKLKLATALSLELTAEEQQQMFNMPATSNSTEKAVVQTSSAVKFASSHPIMGATVLCQEESLIDGVYKIAVSMVWSEALQKSAVATMCGTPGFKETKKGKRSLGEWVESQENPYLLIGPRQYLDKDGVRHFLGISAFPVGRNTVLAQQNKRKAQMDAITTAAFSCLADVETAEAMNNLMNQYSDPKDLDAVPMAEVESTLDSMITQKIQGQAINGVGMVFEKEIEHPLFPGGRLYVYCAELNVDGLAKARELGKKAYLERAKIAYENERFKAIKAKYAAQIEQAMRDGKAAGQREKIDKYKTDDAARAKARLERLKAITAEAKENKAAAKAKLDQIREEMKAAGVYDKYKKFVEAIDGMCSGDTLDAEDTNVE